MSKFEQEFLIGAATAAHQVEGNNIHSDYWAMEHMKYTNFNEPSLDAVDHYNRYEEDIRMMVDVGSEKGYDGLVRDYLIKVKVGH